MDLELNIDCDLCIQCGACVDDCPFHILELSPDFPAARAKRVHHCIRCQHCLAVCPTGALSILGFDPENSLPLPESLPTAAQVDALIRGRRSVRHYRPEPLAAAEIDALLRTVAHAPTGKNNRQWLFTVIDRPEDLAELRRDTLEGLRRAVAERRLSREQSYFRHVVSAWDQGRDILFRNAPHLLMVSVPPSITTPEADIVIAMSYFELAAASRGIGTLWNALISGAFSAIDVDMYRRLGIPDDHVKGYPLLFGRPAVAYHRTVQRDLAQVNRVRLC